MAADPTIARRIGVTMRLAPAAGYDEPRDALARHWAPFLAQALPSAKWLPIPNLGDAAADFARDWSLDALILSGGDTPGDDPLRDASERALLAHAAAAGLPVFGVCRGLQMIWRELGGRLRPVSGHAGSRHRLRFAGAPGWPAGEAEVASFHGVGLADPTPAGVAVLAQADDGSVEAAWSPARRWLGVLWHPERGDTPAAHDLQLLRRLFGTPPGEPACSP